MGRWLTVSAPPTRRTGRAGRHGARRSFVGLPQLPERRPRSSSRGKRAASRRSNFLGLPEPAGVDEFPREAVLGDRSLQLFASRRAARRAAQRAAERFGQVEPALLDRAGDPPAELLRDLGDHAASRASAAVRRGCRRPGRLGGRGFPSPRSSAASACRQRRAERLALACHVVHEHRRPGSAARPTPPGAARPPRIDRSPRAAGPWRRAAAAWRSSRCRSSIPSAAADRSSATAGMFPPSRPALSASPSPAGTVPPPGASAPLDQRRDQARHQCLAAPVAPEPLVRQREGLVQPPVGQGTSACRILRISTAVTPLEERPEGGALEYTGKTRRRSDGADERRGRFLHPSAPSSFIPWRSGPVRPRHLGAGSSGTAAGAGVARSWSLRGRGGRQGRRRPRVSRSFSFTVSPPGSGRRTWPRGPGRARRRRAAS